MPRKLCLVTDVDEGLFFQRALTCRAMEAEAALLIHSGVWR